MSVHHIIKSNLNSSSLGRPINQITPPGIGSNGLVLGSSSTASSNVIAPTAAQMPNGLFYTLSGSTSTFTPPTAPAMYTYLVSIGIQPSVNSSFSFMINNQASGTLTMQTATGVTYVPVQPNPTQLTAVSRVWYWKFSAIDPVNSTAIIY